MWRELKQVIKKAEVFLITTHVNPDGDGLGSAVALCSLLKQMGKTAFFYCDSPLPKKFSFLDFQGTYCKTLDGISFDVMVVLDAHAKERIGSLQTFLEDPAITTLCIDHHVAKEPLSHFAVIDPKACSTGSMIYTLTKELGFELTVTAAIGLYVSVLCDTGRFCNSSTSRKAHKIADECIKLGVDPDQIYSHLFESVQMKDFLIFRKAIHSMETYCDGKVMIQTLTLENLADNPDLEIDWLHELNKKIVEIECSIILLEYSQGQVRVSIRTKGSIDAVDLVKQFQGGGHHRAAGAIVSGEGLGVVKTKLVELVEDRLSSHAY